MVVPPSEMKQIGLYMFCILMGFDPTGNLNKRSSSFLLYIGFILHLVLQTLYKGHITFKASLNNAKLFRN